MDNRLNPTRWAKFSDSTEAELPEYRAVSGLAVAGLLLGLLSVLSMVHVTLCFVGGAAALCSIAALVRISASPSEISGRRLAVTGLVLAVFLTTAGLANYLTNQRLLDLHSREFAALWFDYLKKGEPEKAFELNNRASVRRPLDGELWNRYLSSRDEYDGLRQFVAAPEVRALLALGDRAEVRHYAFAGADPERVAQVYAVTYEDAGIKKSFLVRITLARAPYPDQGVFAWQTVGTTGPWNPDKPS
ncbi:MAG: hypothetical protein GXX96_33085 [Planctomycetaceae bacterium]|nr:hypothetical protein [Planctomycetaceae bacterium]